MAVWGTGRPLDSGRAKWGPEAQRHGAAGRGASRRAARSRRGHGGTQTPAEAAPQLQPPPRPSPRRETEAAGGHPSGAVLTWQNAAPALGPGRAAGPSRASRRGEGRLRAWGERRRRRRDPPDTRCAALQPRRLPPGSAPPGRQGKVGHLFCESAAGGGGAPRRVLAPREGPPPAPRGPGGNGGAPRRAPVTQLPALRPGSRQRQLAPGWFCPSEEWRAARSSPYCF